MTAVESTAELMERELLAAGWKRRRAPLWETPWGGWYFGPYGAWKVMGQVG